MKKKKSSFLHKFILLFNILAVISLILSYLATVIDPEKTWYFALFGLAYPFILLANIIFIIIWLMLKRWYFLLSSTIILIGYQPLTRTFAFRTPSANNHEIDSNTIKLMTYNVHYFKRFGEDLDTITRTSVLKLINEEQPDIIGFEEFFTRKKGKFDIKDSLIKILNTKHYYYNKIIDNDYESMGLAIFSKFPIIKTGSVNYDGIESGNKGIWTDIVKGKDTIRVFAVHLASISFQPEDYSFLNEVKSDINTTSNDVVSSKRIVKKLKNAFVKRSNQIKILKAHMANCNKPFIVMGDFNDTPVSYTLAQMTDGMKNGFSEKGSGLGITYNGEFPNFQIDYVLASQHFDFQSYKIIKKDYSDHYPIRCNVTLNQ